MAMTQELMGYEMDSKCYNCGYEGDFEWQWLITDSKDDSISHTTDSMTPEESKIGEKNEHSR